ncbi:MAG: SDR family NAD(P)-dependent oxidoreductase [Rhodovibrionaceae bacterium]
MVDGARRTAIVTGAARGIGFEVAKALATEGMQLVLLDCLSEVRSAAEELGAEGFVLDVASESEVGRTVAEIAERRGSIDILVNNAGITVKRDGLRVPTEECSLGDWNKVLSVNLTGPFLMCRACIPHMKRRGWGRIVNLASQAGRTGSQFSGSGYAASKAGLIGFSRILAGELGELGITVNCVAPGRIRTPMNALGGEAINTTFAKAVPLRRVGSPEEVASAVAFLASDGGGYITGAVIDVNGGAFMG